MPDPAPRRHAALPPRGMNQTEAAAYLRLPVERFKELVRLGVLPDKAPVLDRWDRVALDRAFDKLSGIANDEAAAEKAEALARARQW